MKTSAEGTRWLRASWRVRASAKACATHGARGAGGRAAEAVVQRLRARHVAAVGERRDDEAAVEALVLVAVVEDAAALADLDVVDLCPRGCVERHGKFVGLATAPLLKTLVRQSRGVLCFVDR